MDIMLKLFLIVLLIGIIVAIFYNPLVGMGVMFFFGAPLIVLWLKKSIGKYLRS